MSLGFHEAITVAIIIFAGVLLSVGWTYLRFKGFILNCNNCGSSFLVGFWEIMTVRTNQKVARFRSKCPVCKHKFSQDILLKRGV